jgi:hypothetical protein
MELYRDNFIIVILLEDEQLHTQENPFCFDPSCPCHEDQELIASVSDAVTSGLVTPVEATRFVKGETL